jgi:hypothetical protein
VPCIVGRFRDRIDNDIKCECGTLEGLQGGRDFLRSPDFEPDDFKAERVGRCLHLAHLQHVAGIVDIAQDRQPAKPRDKLTQQLNSLGGKILGLVRQAGGVAARARQACNQACGNRIPRPNERDRDGLCRLLCQDRWRGCRRDNNIHLEPDELGRNLGVSLGASL